MDTACNLPSGFFFYKLPECFWCRHLPQESTVQAMCVTDLMDAPHKQSPQAVQLRLKASAHATGSAM